VPAEESLDVDLVILDLGLGAGDPGQLPGLQLCAEIKTRYPTLPVLVLSAQSEPVLEAAARQMRADAFGARGMPVADLGQLIEQLARPQAAPLPMSPTSPIRAQSRQTQDVPDLRITNPPPTSPDSRTAPEQRLSMGPWTRLKANLRRSSEQQIEAVMAAIEVEQRRGRADLWSEAVMAGRYRELRAARWLMRKLLATPGWPDDAPPLAPPGASQAIANQSAESRSRLPPRSPVPPGRSTPGSQTAIPNDALAVSGETDLALPQNELATLLFERVFSKLQGCLDNTSNIPLEIDILRDDKKRELLYLTLRKFEDALENLRQASVPPGQLPEKSPLVLRDVWAATLEDFFGRYYTVRVANLEQPVVPTLMMEAEVVQGSILNRIPQAAPLLDYLLFQESMVVDGGLYEATSSAALEHSQTLLEHLLIQVANGVIQPLLNCFADVELMKKYLYHRRMMTSRDIERFRNDLSWRYRWESLVSEPTAIFESQYRLFNFTERGIQVKPIYAPRRDELARLSGLQRAITLTIEARDAIAPRFRSAVSLVGSGIVYILTDVIGRGIGLIGRGILRGVGGAWRDPRYRDSRYRRDPTDDPAEE
jgi:DNA-binding response OmpR family regulator